MLFSDLQSSFGNTSLSMPTRQIFRRLWKHTSHRYSDIHYRPVEIKNIWHIVMDMSAIQMKYIYIFIYIFHILKNTLLYVPENSNFHRLSIIFKLNTILN